MGSAASATPRQGYDTWMKASGVVEKFNLPNDFEEEKKQKLTQQIANLEAFVKAFEGENKTYDGVNSRAPYDKCHSDDADKQKDIQGALSYWNCHRYMYGAYLLALHHDKVNALYEAMGPVKISKEGEPLAFVVTRKSLTAKLKAAEKKTEAQIKAIVDEFMKGIGKEKAQSCLSEKDYYDVVKKLVIDESDEENWDENQWIPKDKSKCPVATKVITDLCKLGDKEFGINRHENRMFWLEMFSNDGEEALKMLENFTKQLTGEDAKGEPKEEAKEEPKTEA